MKRMVLKNVLDQNSIHIYSYKCDLIMNSVQDQKSKGKIQKNERGGVVDSVRVLLSASSLCN